MRLLRSFLWNKKRSKIHNGVSTKRLNEQVKRNIKRFPEDFMEIVPSTVEIRDGLLVDYSIKKLKSQEIFEKFLRFF